MCREMYNKSFCVETQHTHLLTPEREPQADQSIHTTKVQLGETMSFTEITYRNGGEGLHKGAEMARRQLDHQSTPQLKQG